MNNNERDPQQSNRTAEELQQSGEFNTESTNDENRSAAGLQTVINNGRSATDRLADATKAGRTGGSLDGQPGL